MKPQVVQFGLTAANINLTFLLQICLLRLIPTKSVDSNTVEPHLTVSV